MREGDRNSKFFHASLRLKQSRNTFTNILQQHNGDWRKVEEKGKEYYMELFKETLPTEYLHLFKVIPKPVTEEDNQGLARSPDEAKILKVLKEMDQESAPGPHGFGAKFYTFSWEIIQEDLCRAIKEFFIT